MKRPRTETELSQTTSATAPPRKQSRLLADLVPENVIDQPKASVIKFGLKSVTAQPSIPLTSNQDDLNGEEVDSDIDTVKYYPAELTERSQFISDKTRRKVTPFQFKVPKGKLTTYKAISDYLTSAPRAVGQALKNNPFAPFIPCHRVVANNGYVGGFSGQWGSGCKIQSKKAKLKKEGVLVGDDGFVKGWDIVFWNQFK